MKHRVLCVDDDPDVLLAHQRFLATSYTVETASDGAAALARLAQGGPFAVVVSDLEMPRMTGLQLLTTVREQYPDVVRVLLTGQADLDSAIQAVNDGNVFRFLTKPCPPKRLVPGVDAAVAQHELIMADRRRGEQKFHDVLESAPDAVVIVNGEGRVALANHQAVRLFGYRREELVGQQVERLLPGSAGSKPIDVRRLFAPGPEIRQADGDLTARRKDGSELPVEVRLGPLETEGGTQTVAAIRDVSESRGMERQLRQAQKMEAIGQLAAGIAHEINTPIQYIGDNTNFLAGAFDELASAVAAKQSADTDLEYLLEEMPRAIRQTLEGVGHVARIVKAMKEFSHPGGEEKSAVDLNHALETVTAIARNEWKYAADVVTHLAPDLPMVMCLPGELNQVLLNLLVNAAHAIMARPDGGKGTITIVTRVVGASVEVHIIDTGCGIPAHIRDRVFEPFFTTKPAGQGTGQGLALAHAVIVQRHGGSITFESEEGVGTTFILRIPVAGDRGESR